MKDPLKQLDGFVVLYTSKDGKPWILHNAVYPDVQSAEKAARSARCRDFHVNGVKVLIPSGRIVAPPEV